MNPTTGSFPFSLSKADLQKWGVQLLYLLAGTAITYVLQSVIPALHASGQFGLLVLSIVTGMLQLLQKFLADTRPLDERVRMPYRQYLKLKANQ